MKYDTDMLQVVENHKILLIIQVYFLYIMTLMENIYLYNNGMVLNHIFLLKINYYKHSKHHRLF